jgi:hypothetical protein
LRERLSKNQARRWIAIGAIALLILAIILLGYALLPGGEPLRIQSTLNPTIMVGP